MPAGESTCHGELQRSDAGPEHCFNYQVPVFPESLLSLPITDGVSELTLGRRLGQSWALASTCWGIQIGLLSHIGLSFLIFKIREQVLKIHLSSNKLDPVVHCILACSSSPHRTAHSLSFFLPSSVSMIPLHCSISSKDCRKGGDLCPKHPGWPQR